MVKNSNPSKNLVEIICSKNKYMDIKHSNLINSTNIKPAFSCLNIKTSINRMTCENKFCVTVHVSS